MKTRRQASISLAIRNMPGDGDQQWVGTKVISGTPPAITSTTTYAEGGASPPRVFAGDYTGSIGTPQYNASLAVTAAGNQLVAYTNELTQTETDPITGPVPVTDASGNIASNVFYNQLNESTDIAGPHLVSWTDGNGVDLLNTPRSSTVGVNSKYMVLTFDEPMLADNPATDPDSIYNIANYQIYDSNGNLLSNVISHVDYGLTRPPRCRAFTASPTSIQRRPFPTTSGKSCSPSTTRTPPPGPAQRHVHLEIAGRRARHDRRTNRPVQHFRHAAELDRLQPAHLRAFHEHGHHQQLDQSGHRADSAGHPAAERADQRRALCGRRAV